MQAIPTDATADALTGLAPMLRVRPELQDLCWFSGPWRSEHPAEPAGFAPFHIVTQGACRIRVASLPPLDLGAGDVVLLPQGEAHAIGDGSGAGHGPPVRVRAHGSVRFKSNVAAEPETEVICGRLHFGAGIGGLVPALLPRMIVMRTEGETALRIRALILAIRDELGQARVGAAAIAADLASALLMMALRAHLETDRAGSSLLRLLSEAATARLLRSLALDPARAWTLDAMAEEAHVSRATLVRAFRRAAGLAPLTFLTDLRLALAQHRLATSDAPLGRIAAEVGYESESAFSRAFLRRFGLRPGEARRVARPAA
ncbi:AraC family transcriptional regulator [Methylobacterium oxalidis]|uniref:AraC family transcriptional regulator n=1 Tax=Methylobacterium oxalidis TaxID=944322 RepID=A0A512J5T5_9HYPH|nr:AraC family transcriptional regulator [Methylobacterium oxalidis]GEP05336.1 AraC family transcriptional regulator [Methylobacterium oxalidis]GJE31347.1 RCS-specific HTH-type transcriptional activator RclR [Methylobacterium oxalidis]GLS63525.1 AraC family transcriptional regulator [Methylobacterium oxalidis]